MTRAELRTQVYELTGRPSTYARLSTTQIDEYVNEGMIRLAQETLPPALLDILSINTANNTANYETTGNPLRIVSIAVGGNVLEATTLQRLYASVPGWQSASTGTPTHWMNYGRGATGYLQYKLWPTPSSTAAASVVVLKTPAAMPSSGEILEWDELCQYGLAYFAAWRHLQNKTEVDSDGHAEKMLQNFNTIVDMYRRINGVESFNSQESQLQTVWRQQQGG